MRTAFIAVAALAVVATTAQTAPAMPIAKVAKKNPYTAKGLCGPSFFEIERKRLYDVSPNTGRTKHLSTAVLMYSNETGENCAVHLKRRRIDKPDNVNITIETRNPKYGTGDGGPGIGYYAGPVKIPARGKCILWRGSTEQVDVKGSFAKLYDGWRSGWKHCD